MAKQLGPLEIDCDAPPYAIVRACLAIGIQSPEDVGWRRLCHYLNAPLGGREALQSQPWLLTPGLYQPTRKLCVCGQQLPDLVRCNFTFLSGKEKSYFLGQCSRCHTVFWEEA
jgi:hypothetical protein